jgi:hypothetical protein
MLLYMSALFALMLMPGTAVADGFNPENESLSAREIVDRCVARSETQNKAMKGANFESESVTKNQKLDGDGNITETETLLHRQYPLNGAVYEELVEKNGRPLTEKEAEKEQENKEAFIEETEERRMRGDYLQPEKEQAIQFDAYFASKYDYELVDTEWVRNYRCWKISFRPKEGKLPVRNRMDNALNQLSGTFWVSQDDYGLARVEFSMSKPFKYWGGLLAVVRKTDGSVDYTRVGSNVWLPLYFNLKLDIRIMLFKSIRQMITKDWKNYRQVSAADSEFASNPGF